MPLKLMISAAEVSGDVAGAALAKELIKATPDVSLFGMGGENMKAAGVDVKLDITETSTIGLLEILKYLPSHLKSFKSLVSLMRSEKPDALIVIDAQGFHVPLVKEAKKLGIKTIYYIAPQEWLWGTEKRVKEIAGTLDLIVAIFEKECETYKKAGANVIYFGHPLIDIAKPKFTKQQLREGSSVNEGAPFVGLFPGSRRQEIEGLLPVMLDAVKLIESGFGKVNPLLGLSTPKFKTLVEKIVGDKKVDLSIIEGGTYDVLAACDVSLAASGTILLEAAILQSPVIMMYKLSPLSYFIGKHILHIDRKLPYFAMPNLLANKKIIPEYVMGEANAENLAKEAVSLLKDKARIEAMRREMRDVTSKLGQPGVISKAAKGILDFLLH